MATANTVHALLHNAEADLRSTGYFLMPSAAGEVAGELLRELRQRNPHASILMIGEPGHQIIRCFTPPAEPR